MRAIIKLESSQLTCKWVGELGRLILLRILLMPFFWHNFFQYGGRASLAHKIQISCFYLREQQWLKTYTWMFWNIRFSSLWLRIIAIFVQNNAPCHIIKYSDLEREIRKLWDEVDCAMLEKLSQSMLKLAD